MSTQSTKAKYLDKQLSAQVQQIIKNTGSIETQIQSFLNKLFMDVIEYNVRWSHINDLYKGLSEKTLNKKDIKNWIQKYTPLHWSDDQNAFVKGKKKWDKELLVTGQHNPWHNFVKPKRKIPPKEWNKAKNLKSFLGQAEKLLALANNANDEDSAKLLQSIIDSLK